MTPTQLLEFLEAAMYSQKLRANIRIDRINTDIERLKGELFREENELYSYTYRHNHIKDLLRDHGQSDATN